MKTPSASAVDRPRPRWRACRTRVSWRARGRLLAALIVAVSLAAAPVAAVELQVLAAASLRDALTEVVTSYERQTGDRVRLDFGASSTLALQIEKGAPADLFFSADEAKMDELDRHGRLLAGTRRSLLGNSLAVVVPADDARPLLSIGELAGPRCRRLALAEPQTVPAGVYARTYLERLGLWPQLRDRVLPTANVRAALAAVAAGNADAAIVYLTDAAVSKRVRVALAIPAGEGPRITYPVAVLAESREPTAARRLLAAIASPAGLAVFARHGFLAASAAAATPASSPPPTPRPRAPEAAAPPAP